MAGDSFNSAGADASTGIMSFMAALEAKRRQDKLDAMTAQQQQFDQQMHLRDMNLKESKEQREAEQHKADLAERASQNASQRDVMAENIKTKQIGDVEKQLGNMQPGDYPDSQLIANMDRLGMGANAPKPGIGQQSMPGIVAPNAPQTMGVRVAPQPNEPPAQMGLTGASDPAVRPFLGSPKQRDAADMQHRQQVFLAGMPDTDPRKAALRQSLEAEAAGFHLPPGFLDKPASGKTHLLLNPVTGVYTDPKTGKPTTDIPADAVIDRMAEPKDTSAGAANHELAVQRLGEQVRNRAYTVFDKLAAPAQDTIRNVQKLKDVLDQNTNIADSTIAEQVLRVTAGGKDSGLRLNTNLTDRVLHSRDRWDNLNMALHQWDGKPGSLVLTPQQKTDIRALGKELLKQASTVHQKIIKARQIVDDPSSDPTTIHKAVTSLESDLNTPDEEATSTPATPTSLPAGVTVKKVR